MTNLSFKQRELNIKSAQKNMDRIIRGIKYYKPRKHKGTEDKICSIHQRDRHTHTDREGGRDFRYLKIFEN